MITKYFRFNISHCTFRIFLVLLLQCVMFNVQCSMAYAAETGLSIHPPLLEVVIKPGKVVTQVFNIQNLSFAKKTLVARIIPFEPSASGLPILRPDLTPKWLSYFTFANSFISPNVPFTLEPNAKSQIVLGINIPNNILLQDIYATLLISTEKEDGIQDNVTSLTSIASNILLSVSDKENPQTATKIENFEVNPKNILFRYKQYFFIDSLEKITFLATAKNTGPHFTKIGGLLRISQNGLPVQLQGLIPLNLLSDSSRQIAASPSGELIFQPQANHFGNFLAELDLRAANSSAHSELNLIVLPFKISLGLVVSLLLLFLIYRKSYEKS